MEPACQLAMETACQRHELWELEPLGFDSCGALLLFFWDLLSPSAQLS